MTYLKKLIQNRGYTIKSISDRLDIPYRTLQRWLYYDGIDSHIKFLRLIVLLNISFSKLLDDIKQQKK